MKCRLMAVAVAIGVVLGGATGWSPAGATPGTAPGTTTDAALAARAGSGWVGTWEAAVARDATKDLANHTIRNVVHISLGGTSVRVRLSNAFGTSPLVFGHVTVAIQADGDNSPVAAAGTMREVRFAGRRSVTAPAGADVVSDPVPLAVPAQADLLVTAYLPASSGPATYHSYAAQSSFLSPGGDAAADPTGASFTTEAWSWYYLTGVDVRNSGARGSVVAFGDSITDGVGSTYGANLRWPDLLAERLLAQPPARRMGVQNAGISGNRVLLDGMIDAFGPSALDRLDSDVLSRTGVRTVILMEGINDIQQTPNELDATKITGAYRTIVDRLHARGIRVVGATLTPFKGWTTYEDRLEPIRLAVNDFIRTSRVFDAVVDFDAVIRDPADPHRMAPAYDLGDHLHPNDAGYRAMATAVDLRTL